MGSSCYTHHGETFVSAGLGEAFSPTASQSLSATRFKDAWPRVGVRVCVCMSACLCVCVSVCLCMSLCVHVRADSSCWNEAWPCAPATFAIQCPPPPPPPPPDPPSLLKTMANTEQLPGAWQRCWQHQQQQPQQKQQQQRQ